VEAAPFIVAVIKHSTDQHQDGKWQYQPLNSDYCPRAGFLAFDPLERNIPSDKKMVIVFFSVPIFHS
jgi:hypothetical protein